MNTTARNALRALVALGCVVVLSGCELVADFDRSKIPTPSAPGVDAGRDDDDDAGEAPEDAGQDAEVLPDASDDDAGASDDDAGQDEDAG